MESNIIHTEFDERDIKPMEFAIQHFKEIPSLFMLKDILISDRMFEGLLSKFNGPVRRKYDAVQEPIFDKLEILNFLVDNMVAAINVKENFYESYTEHTEQSEINNNDVVLSITFIEDSYIHINKRKKTIKARISIFYKNQNTLNNFLEIAKKDITINKEKIIEHNSYISLVTKNGNGQLDTTEFEIKNPKINIPLSYGEEFKEIDKNIFNTLKKSDKGIWVFHGPPGTGKSMYIRQLIKKLNKSGKVGTIIYMPSEMVGAIESPDFIPFIQDYQDAVLVIEDADVALESRKSHGSIVKTILQLTDGILADCLRLKIIATFNCELAKIDDALLRKGRLQIRHEFRYLNRNEAIALAADLKIDLSIFDNDDYKNKTEWTLAEIYNIQTNFYWDKKQAKLGFGK